MSTTASLKPLSSADIRPSTRYVDVAPGRHVSVRVERVRSRNKLTERQRANLQALRLDRKGRRAEVHPLSRVLAGHVSATQRLLKTEFVLASGNTVEAQPHEVVQLATEEPAVKSSAYEIEGQPAISLDWTSGEHSRIEQLADFTLFAWTSRLSSGHAVRLLKGLATKDSLLFVLTSEGDLLRQEAQALDKRYVDSRADRVCLLRLENPETTLLWELRQNDRTARHADFVVMGATERDRIKTLIEETGVPRVVMACEKIIELGCDLGAL